MNNDTHGVEGKGWYGFDLDGTLAKYDGWKGIDHIGEPVKPMVELIRRMHDEGKIVKIMTARVAPRANAEYKAREKCVPPGYAATADFSGLSVDAKTWVENMYLVLDTWGAREFVIDWCLKNLGFLPEITHEKDHLMLELYDDHVKQVVPNEGWLVEDIAMSKRQRTEITIVKREFIDVRWWERVNCFMLGMMVAAAIVVAIHMYVAATTTVPEAEGKLHDAVRAYIQSKLDDRVEGLLK